jgi:hypothetical protein
MDEYLTSFDDGILDESIGESIKFFDIFFCAAVEVKIQVFEVFRPFCVLLAGHIQDVSDPCFQQVPCLEP